ncbi:uncharacterized protein [Apostichopus japonicus]|uniref:uncharacterized protein isoform X2 n=1 Tax=Stichopus japonicus TaxID=307972 RepID=UPI003AB555E2
MTDWSKRKRVFPITYSRNRRSRVSLTSNRRNPLPLISNVVDTYIPPTTSPVSSDDSSFSSDSNSSQYSENSQFLSFTERQSSAMTSTLYDSTDTSDGSKHEVLQKNPKAPFRARPKVQYSIIIEESDDTGRPTAPKKNTVPSSQTANKLQKLCKTTNFGRKMQGTTKLTKDSLRQESEDAEDSFSDSNFMTIDSIEDGTEDDELTVVRESSLPRQSTIDSEVQDIGKSQKFCPRKDILDADDIEVMRDAPPTKLVGKGTKDRGESVSDALTISPAKLFLRDMASKSNLHKKKWRAKGKKNSTLTDENHWAKHIQDVSVFQDISDISGSNLTSSGGVTSEEDAYSTLKGVSKRTGSNDSTLKEIHTNIQKAGPVSKLAKEDNQAGFIKTPKKHNIKRTSAKKLPPVLVDTAHTKQVSFNKKNEESIYVPGSRIKASPASTNFPKLSPSVSILKKAVSTWNLEPPEEQDKEQPKATTSTPLFKRRRRSRHKPNMMDFSFELSSVPLPSYNDKDLMVTAYQCLGDENHSSPNMSPAQLSPATVNHSTPSQQLKRASPEGSIPNRPLKRRCSLRLWPSSADEVDVNKMDHPKSTTNRQKQKKLEYTSVGVGLDECTITTLPDSLFIKDILTTIPDIESQDML